MREISINDIGEALRKLLDAEHPVDEDIGVLDARGQLKGVVIPPEAYEFFLQKVEEAEDRADIESVEAFHRSGEKDA